jgi:hypothetical protein
MDDTFAELDKLASSWPTKQNQSDFLSKRVNQVHQTLDSFTEPEEDKRQLLLESEFPLCESLRQIAKVNEQTPLAYNLFFATQELRQIASNSQI